MNGPHIIHPSSPFSRFARRMGVRPSRNREISDNVWIVDGESEFSKTLARVVGLDAIDKPLLESFTCGVTPPSVLQLDDNGYGLFHRLLRLPSELVIPAMDVLLPVFGKFAIQRDAWDNLPLHIAIEYHPRECRIVQPFYEHSRKLKDLRDSVGRYPIHLAIASCASTDVLTLLRQKVTPVDGFGMTPLHYSFRCHWLASTTTFRVCTENYGSALRQQDSWGRLPLHVALESNIHYGDVHYRVFCDLARLCCDIEVLGVPDNEGRLPIHVALDTYRSDRWMERQEALRIELIADPRWPDLLLHQDAYGRTPLQVGLYRGISIRVVRKLLSIAKASIECTDRSGMLPFEAACEHCSVSVIFDLLIRDPGFFVGRIRR